MEVLAENGQELSVGFIDALNTSGPQARFELVKRFLATCVLKNIDAQMVINNTFCGEYKVGFVNMVNFALALSK